LVIAREIILIPRHPKKGVDGRLTYGWEKVLEAYYDMQICEGVHAGFDYQFVANPAFNRDRGPVSISQADFIGNSEVGHKPLRERTDPHRA
jgi:hypothetical protein